MSESRITQITRIARMQVTALLFTRLISDKKRGEVRDLAIVISTTQEMVGSAHPTIALIIRSLDLPTNGVRDLEEGCGIRSVATKGSHILHGSF